MIDTGLKNKMVVVTGANNPYGIGAGVAKAFAAQGARVFLHYFRIGKGAPLLPETQTNETASPGEVFYYAQQATPPDEVLRTIHEMGGQADAWEADLSDSTVIPALFDRAERALGPVEVLVNNAAYWEADTFIPSNSDLRN